MGYCRGGSRTTATSRLEAVNYYHKELHLGCCSNPRSASVLNQTNGMKWVKWTLLALAGFVIICMKLISSSLADFFISEYPTKLPEIVVSLLLLTAVAFHTQDIRITLLSKSEDELNPNISSFGFETWLKQKESFI